MSPSPSEFASVAALQSACQRCPLHVTGPVAVSAPLVAQLNNPLVVMDSPLGAPTTPRHDARFRRLCRVYPLAKNYSATYALNCRVDVLPPQRAVDACGYHRQVELSILAPRVVIAVGDRACQTYLGQALSDVYGRPWSHPAGSVVLPIRDSLGPLSEDELALFATYLESHAAV